MDVFLIVFIIMIVGLIMVYKKSTHKKVKPFPKHWHQLLIDRVDFYKQLNPLEQNRFQERVMLFLSEVFIESVDFTLEETDELLVAASAVIPVFAFPEWHYANLSTVLIYPSHFNEDLGFRAKDKQRNITGMIGYGQFENQMILSRIALHQGFEKNSDVYNTAIHEFVHLIDKADGIVDGVPERLIQHRYILPWLELIYTKMEEIHQDQSDIRSYGGTNEAEFFAVASEYFFENPSLMKKEHPDLYQMLSVCFRFGIED